MRTPDLGDRVPADRVPEVTPSAVPDVSRGASSVIQAKERRDTTEYLTIDLEVHPRREPVFPVAARTRAAFSATIRTEVEPDTTGRDAHRRRRRDATAGPWFTVALPAPAARTSSGIGRDPTFGTEATLCSRSGLRTDSGSS
jgi:hypothetical protein